MVTVKASQKIFTDSEVATLTGICVDHIFPGNHRVRDSIDRGPRARTHLDAMADKSRRPNTFHPGRRGLRRTNQLPRLLAPDRTAHLAAVVEVKRRVYEILRTAAPLI